MLWTFSGVALSMLNSRKVLEVFDEKGVSASSTSFNCKPVLFLARMLGSATEDAFRPFGLALLFGDATGGGELGGE
jgi:hypothetical protein